LSRFSVAAAKAALEAGALLHSRFGRRQKISFKGRVDLVTEMDHRSQELIIRRLGDEFPGHDFLSEELPPVQTGSRYRWIIDPLDGTTNYAHGFPIYCVSIALAIDDRIAVGAVHCPALREHFTAVRGRGACLNGRRIRVSKVDRLDRALLATGFPYDVRTSRVNNIRNFERFAKTAQAVRRAGAAALDLCYVGAGRFDGFWELKLKTWDMAAGMLVVTESGGTVTDFRGGPVDMARPTVLASNGLIHEQMQAVLARCV